MKAPSNGKITPLLAQCMAMDVRCRGVTLVAKAVLRSILKHFDWPGGLATRSRAFPISWVAGDLEREEAVVSRSIGPLVAAGLLTATRLTNGLYSFVVHLDRLTELQVTKEQVVEASAKGRRKRRQPQSAAPLPGDKNVANPGDKNVAESDLLLSEVALFKKKSASSGGPSESASRLSEEALSSSSEPTIPSTPSVLKEEPSMPADPKPLPQTVSDKARAQIMRAAGIKPNRKPGSSQAPGAGVVEQAALLCSIYETKRKQLDDDFSLRASGKGSLREVAKKLIELRIFEDRWQEYVDWVFEEWVEWGGEDRAPWPPIKSLGYDHYVEKWADAHPMIRDHRQAVYRAIEHLDLNPSLINIANRVMERAVKLARGEEPASYRSICAPQVDFEVAAIWVAAHLDEWRWIPKDYYFVARA